MQTGFPMGIRGGSQAFIKFTEDGTVTVITGIVDNGQGNDNMIIQITAEELGLAPEDIQLVTADTEVTPSDPGSYSMCETFVGGNAVSLPQRTQKGSFSKSPPLCVGEEDLKARNRKIMVTILTGHVRRQGSKNCTQPGQSISGQGAYWPKVDPKREWVENPYGQLSEAFSFGT